MGSSRDSPTAATPGRPVRPRATPGDEACGLGVSLLRLQASSGILPVPITVQEGYSSAGVWTLRTAHDDVEATFANWGSPGTRLTRGSEARAEPRGQPVRKNVTSVRGIPNETPTLGRIDAKPLDSYALSQCGEGVLSVSKTRKRAY